MSGVAITGVGMVTSVGHSAAEACASIRAGIALIEELEYFVVENDWFEEVPLAGCALFGVTDGYLGLGRWARLATAAIADLLDNAGLTAAELASSGLFLALPPAERSGVDTRILEMLGVRIGQWMRADGIERHTRVYPFGHAATAMACREATLEVQSGRIPRAILCGVDSLVEPETLRFLYDRKRLKTEDHVDGFIPAEGAACFVIEPTAQAERRGAEVLAYLEAPNTAVEPVTIWSDEPSPGTGLSDAVRGTLQQLPDQGRRTGLVVCDLNGETYRAKEFGNTATRVLNGFEVEWNLWHPADCIGDTGSASFAISTCVAATALQKGYANSQGVLVWGSSDDGLRGSVYLRPGK